MKILQINAVYGHGSTGTIVRDIEKLCEQSGMETYIASPDTKVREAKRGYIIGNLFDHKFHALLSRINGKQGYFSHIPTYLFLRWIDTISPDIIHLHNLHSNYINLNMLLRYIARKKIKTIITLHDCWFFTGGCFHYTSNKCVKWQNECGDCPKKMDDTPCYLNDCSNQILADRKLYLNKIPNLTIIGASQWVANECKKSILKNHKINYIHNGFNLNIFKPTPSDLRKRLGLENKYILLGLASKWYAPINKDTLEYFLSNMKDDMTLVIFGCSKFHKNISPKIKELGYINSPTDMAALYSMADVFVNCTREDTLPGINIECQATGTPVITYDATGCKETIDGIFCKSVPTGEYINLFNEVLKLKKIGKQNISNECIKWIHDNYELKYSYSKYIELYRNV